MYKDHFGLREEPFSIAPDPQFLYMSERHREALAHLLYGMKTDGGFVLLTGEVGTGKTTVCRCLLEQVPENSEIAYVLNPRLSVVELLATICDELKIVYPAGNQSLKLFVDALNSFLLEAHGNGRKTVLIIDEAQNLPTAVLEQIRLLTNLETNKQKLLQVIMLGQPELKQRLGSPELRQLAQRITARYHLEPLSKNEIHAYLSHRLSVAGVERSLFSTATINKLYPLSGGVPRLINLLCDRALLGAYVKDQHTVSPALLAEAASEVFGKKLKSRWRSAPAALWPWALLIPAGLVGSVFLLQVYLAQQAQPLIEPENRLPIRRELPTEVLTWDHQEPIDRSSVLAYQVLFARWGVEYHAAKGTARSQAEHYGLNLIVKRGSLGRLRQLNRPVVLKLSDPQGQEFFAAMTALGRDTATLMVGKAVHIVPIETLNAQWYGEFSLLWQAPPNYRGAVRPGAQGQVVQWLEAQMAALHGRNARTTAVSVLEGLLLEEVQQFQVEAGLEPDGIVGTYTLILLNSRASKQHPTLIAGQRG